MSTSINYKSISGNCHLLLSTHKMFAIVSFCDYETHCEYAHIAEVITHHIFFIGNPTEQKSHHKRSLSSQYNLELLAKKLNNIECMSVRPIPSVSMSVNRLWVCWKYDFKDRCLKFIVKILITRDHSKWNRLSVSLFCSFCHGNLILVLVSLSLY